LPGITGSNRDKKGITILGFVFLVRGLGAPKDTHHGHRYHAVDAGMPTNSSGGGGGRQSVGGAQMVIRLKYLRWRRLGNQRRGGAGARVQRRGGAGVAAAAVAGIAAAGVAAAAVVAVAAVVDDVAAVVVAAAVAAAVAACPACGFASPDGC